MAKVSSFMYGFMEIFELFLVRNPQGDKLKWVRREEHHKVYHASDIDLRKIAEAAHTSIVEVVLPKAVVAAHLPESVVEASKISWETAVKEINRLAIEPYAGILFCANHSRWDHVLGAYDCILDIETRDITVEKQPGLLGSRLAWCIRIAATNGYGKLQIEELKEYIQIVLDAMADALI